jgi:hypothetical protein
MKALECISARANKTAGIVHMSTFLVGKWFSAGKRP